MSNVSGKMSDQVSVENSENLKSVYLYWNVCVAWNWGFDGSVKQLSLTGRHGLPTHVERCSKLGGSLVVRVPPLLSRHRLESALPPPASMWRRVPWFGRGGAWSRGVQWRTDSVGVEGAHVAWLLCRPVSEALFYLILDGGWFYFWLIFRIIRITFLN